MQERRHHLRHRVSTLAYVTLPDSGGGILLDVSEGGMGLQTVGQVAPQQLLHFNLELSGTPHRVEGGSKVIWAGPSGQAGLQFLDISEDSRQQLNDWLFMNALSGWNPPPSPVPPAPPVRPPVQHSAPVAAAATRETLPRPVIPATLPSAPRPVRREAPAAKPPIKPGVLVGPFALTVRSIEANVSSDSRGVFVLGQGTSRSFEVLKVGRSDDLKNALAEYVGKYREFKFAFSQSELDAWERECQLYHQHRPKDNKFHPARRYGTDWDCPVCHGFA